MQSKLAQTGTSIFTVMSKMAADYNAINLSQGYPDFEVSPELSELVLHNIKKGHNQYAPMPGVPELRKVIADKIKKIYNTDCDFGDNVTITTGATEGLFSSISALVSAGDEVIYFEPGYDSYYPAINLNHGVPIPIKLSHPDFSYPWDEVASKITERTKLIIINSPHNPSGKLISESDLETLYSLIEGKNIYVLSDEVYEHIVFEGNKHHSILSHEGFKNQGIAVFSFGKTFHVTGWKMGYTVAPKLITDEIRKMHQFITFSVNTPIQHAVAEYLKDESNYNQLPSFFQSKRDCFVNKMKGSKFVPLKSDGTYFQTFSYEKIDAIDDVSFAEMMIRDYGVASIPFSAFYGDRTDNHLIRFCFAKKEETLEKAAEILCRI